MNMKCTSKMKVQLKEPIAGRAFKKFDSEALRH